MHPIVLNQKILHSFFTTAVDMT